MRYSDMRFSMAAWKRRIAVDNLAATAPHNIRPDCCCTVTGRIAWQGCIRLGGFNPNGSITECLIRTRAFFGAALYKITQPDQVQI